VARLAPLALAFLLPTAAAAQTGTVTGTVRNAATGLPVSGAVVYVYTANVEGIGNATTNAAGFFSLTSVPVGTYFAVAFSPTPSQLLSEVFPDLSCAVCNTAELLEGTPFLVTSGGTTANRNFSLDPTASISGTITNAANGTPIQNVNVTIFGRTPVTNALFGAGSFTTDASGVYTATGLKAGTYFAFTTNNLGFVNEVYDGVTCVGTCTTNQYLSGTPIVTTSGGTTTGRNFALDTGGRLTGTITNAATGAPLQNIGVNVVTLIAGASAFAGSATTDATGTYTVTGLPAGTYYAFTNNNQGFMNEIYDDLLCPLSCLSNTAAQNGVPIPVTLGGTVTGRDFALNQGGSISGTVLNQNTAAPLSGVTVSAAIRVGTTNFSTSVSTDAAGNYTIRGLPTGAYRLLTNNAQGFINEIYDNQQCRGSCTIANAIVIGSPVSVTAGATTTGNDFGLQPGGSITGTVLDGASGLPARNLIVEAYAVVGGVLTLAGNSGLNGAGAYEIRGLQSGTYFVATSGSHTWRNEVFDNLPCLGISCSLSLVATGAPVPVTAGAATPNRNFALAIGDLVQGRITDASTGSALNSVTVSLFHNPSGSLAGQAQTGPHGLYTIRGIPNGNYVAFTSNSHGYFNEIFNNIRCATTCSVATALAAGTPVQVVAAASDDLVDPNLVLGTNFELDPRTEPPGAPTNFRATVANGTAQFSWTAATPSTTGIATSFVIDAGVSPGGTILSLPATGTSHSVTGVPPGVFYVRVRAINAFGSSPPSSEVTLVVGGGSNALPDAPTDVTAFMSGGRLTLTWSAALNGGPSSSFLVEAGTATGAANIATLPVAGRAFTFVPVPNGFYFLRVRAANPAGVSPPSGEVMIVVGGVASPPGAPNFSSHSVSGSTVTLNWQAPTLGTATSYIIEAGSATGLANLATVNTGSTSLTASFSGVPPGTYFVRIRAVNALGASVVSNERTVIVN
jgi:5-hydroxyisourate hydrolase-like protein (transthyretin family)